MSLLSSHWLLAGSGEAPLATPGAGVRRKRPGDTPYSRRNAPANANSVEYPTRRAIAERVPEGVRVSGRWPNVSGCEDAAWAGLALTVDGTFSFAVVPVADLAVERTWQMAGMRGTGSHTLVAGDLLVPADRVAAAASFALSDLLLYATTVLGPVVGAAQGALDVINAMFASDRKPFMTAYSRMGESSGARQWLAEATHLVNRAERTMLSVAQVADSAELSEADGPHPHLNPYLAIETFGAALAGHP